MDWPTQTRAISTIHSVLREQAKVYPADTIVYPVATIHSMKSLRKGTQILLFGIYIVKI